MVLLTPTKVFANNKNSAPKILHWFCADAPLPGVASLSEPKVIFTRQSRWSVKSTNPPFGGYKMLTNSKFDLTCPHNRTGTSNYAHCIIPFCGMQEVCGSFFAPHRARRLNEGGFRGHGQKAPTDVPTLQSKRCEAYRQKYQCENV